MINNDRNTHNVKMNSNHNSKIKDNKNDRNKINDRNSGNKGGLPVLWLHYAHCRAAGSSARPPFQG